MLHYRPMALRIPKEEQAGLIKIFSLDEAVVQALISALTTAPPTLKVSNLTDIVVSNTSLEGTDARIIVDTIISLYSARAYFGYSISDFVEQIHESLRDSDIDKLRILAADGDVVKATLEKLLNIEPIGTAMKAETVLREYERSFCDARILTDVRPIFGTNAEDVPVGASVIHNLRIAYHEGKELKEFFVALSNNDIQDLSNVLRRAEDKNKSLESVLDNAKIRRLDFK